MFVINYRKIFYTISILLIGFSVFAISFWGINFGIDFTGGSILEIRFQDEKLQKNDLLNTLNGLDLQREFSVRETGDSGYIIRAKELSDEQKSLVINAISETGKSFEEVRFNNVGPTLGKELQNRALLAMFLVILAIVIFIAIAFSQVSKPVSSWKYGIVAVITFIHDVIIPIGLFAILGRFYGVEVDTLFVIAILVVLGYSINDTIIVFDRIRENLKEIPEKIRKEKFSEVVGKSLSQTISRSINTSLTTLVTLLALFLVGGDATKWFSLALMSGILAGTYSSIFFAAPMLVTFNKLDKQN
ncbi:MAG TPA: protein translocase subunit SecF [Candidatus Paceibacterota bacterium]|nr:protein translocase subunit SecF [Candidatus Paceibacterota bacterium]HMP19175.1 protein translocase subunit SecF [Candidatus Paceibacterota bacterium]